MSTPHDQYPAPHQPAPWPAPERRILGVGAAAVLGFVEAGLAFAVVVYLLGQPLASRRTAPA